MKRPGVVACFVAVCATVVAVTWIKERTYHASLQAQITHWQHSQADVQRELRLIYRQLYGDREKNIRTVDGKPFTYEQALEEIGRLPKRVSDLRAAVLELEDKVQRQGEDIADIHGSIP